MADFYTVNPDDEHLHHATVDEAVLDWIEPIQPDCWPKTIKVLAYARMRPKPTQLDARILVQEIIERWNEELGDPDDDLINLSALSEGVLIEQAFSLLKEAAARYEPWACERKPDVDVDVEQWALRNGFPPMTLRSP